jgi:ferric-dicitrate binding protein FerR (iron transport regulator)
MDKSELIFKVLSKEASGKEIAELEEWMALNDTNKTDYAELKLIWEDMQSENKIEYDEERDEELKKIKALTRKKEKKQQRMFTAAWVLAAFSISSILYFLITSSWEQYNNDVSLKFHHAPMSQVIVELEEEYNIDIEATSNIMGCEFTGSFYNDTAPRVLKNIAQSMKFQYSTIDERTFKLEGSGCTTENKN